MDDAAGMVLGRLDLPQLFEADAISLRPAVAAQIEALLEDFREGPAAALGEQRLLGKELDAGLEVRRGLAILADALGASRNAGDAASLVEQHLGAGKARIDFDAQRLGLLGEPTAEIAEADDVIAAIVHVRRRRQAQRVAARQEQEAILARWRLERRAALPPIGEKLVERTRLQHRARQYMCADLRAFLDDADRDLLGGNGSELLQADGRGEAGGAGADDHHVVSHLLAFHGSRPSHERHYRKSRRYRKARQA